MAACPRCATANPPEARFCMTCGGSLAPVAAPSAERKVITSLFCDLVGSTTLGDLLDAEDVDRLQRSYHAIARRRIESHGGIVEKFIGDAVVGMFGFPVAHEDDAERAVRAALRLIDELAASGLGLHVRIGINTGETFVRTDLDPASGEGFATGDSLNTAARLEAAAPVDGILVGEATRQACADAFTWEDAGELELKGKAATLRAWRPVAPRTRGASDASPEATPFVGREFELETLTRLFDRSRSTPSLEVVTIVAEPGIGKSRLVRELARHVAGLPEPTTWLSGRCLPYGDGVGFWALAEIVAMRAGILETDDQATLGSKLDAVLDEPDPALRSWMRDRIGPLVGLSVTGSSPVRDEAFTAWRRFLESIARAAPLVLVVEDLHWADDAFAAFLLDLVANVAGVPLLLVVTARPEIEERHPRWLARARRSTVLSLGALGEASIRALLQDVLPGASPEVLATVLERAGGSPLYAEQLAAMLRERGTKAPDLAIPPTIHALLSARIDALPRDRKPALLDASVIGKTFWAGAVATLGDQDPADVEPVLADLARRELARPAFPSSMEGETEYAFWHALLRDVAYAQLPRAARLAKHRAAAAWIAERSRGTGGRTAEIVAEHYARALELATSLGAEEAVADLTDRLVDALLAAADHATWTSAARSVEHLRRLLGLVADDDPRRVIALVALGKGLLAMAEMTGAIAALDDARELLLASGGPVAAAEIAPVLGAALANAGLADRANAVLDEGRRALEPTPGAMLLRVMGEQAMMHVRRGDYAAAARLGEEVVALADSLGLPPPPRALMAIGGDANYRRAIEIADAAGDLRMASIGRYNRAIHAHGRVDSWLPRVEEALEFDATHGLYAAATQNLRATVLFYYLGEADGLVEDLLVAESRARAQGDGFGLAQVVGTLAEIRVLRGEPVASLDEIVALFAAAGMGTADYTMALVAICRGDAAEARPFVAALLETPLDNTQPWLLVDWSLRVGDHELAERAAALPPTPGGWGDDPERTRADEAVSDANVGRLAEADGDLGEALRRYETAVAVFTEFGWNVAASVVGTWLGRCLLALGRRDEARARLMAARVVPERLGLRPALAEIDGLLAAAGEGETAEAGRAASGRRGTPRAPR